MDRARTEYITIIIMITVRPGTVRADRRVRPGVFFFARHKSRTEKRGRNFTFFFSHFHPLLRARTWHGNRNNYRGAANTFAVRRTKQNKSGVKSEASIQSIGCFCRYQLAKNNRHGVQSQTRLKYRSIMLFAETQSKKLNNFQYHLVNISSILIPADVECTAHRMEKHWDFLKVVFSYPTCAQMFFVYFS